MTPHTMHPLPVRPVPIVPMQSQASPRIRSVSRPTSRRNPTVHFDPSTTAGQSSVIIQNPYPGTDTVPTKERDMVAPQVVTAGHIEDVATMPGVPNERIPNMPNEMIPNLTETEYLPPLSATPPQSPLLRNPVLHQEPLKTPQTFNEDEKLKLQQLEELKR